MSDDPFAAAASSPAVGRTRILVRQSTSYMVTEPFDSVMEALRSGSDLLVFTSVTGQAAFDAEALTIRASEIVSVQEVSAAAWIWQQRAAELHYARTLQEQSEASRHAAAAERLADAIAGQENDE